MFDTRESFLLKMHDKKVRSKFMQNLICRQLNEN